ncbi:alpha/beta fold hydrolase [Tomitella fengzijianii]|uniref:Alpha/beta hydrolase n=1 Tax=Tomitella fengzijianii TaxID=2597660 RepID=A0A516X8M1_9ACTN|nr:alpha/beta hydrolase [Tomitella fengzijianii]QDQ99398.1 alpha/beta hydrolase [Tomitella fengzijianii]
MDAGRAWCHRHGAVSHRVPVDGGVLHAVEIPVPDAEGTPVVFCHGFPGSWFSWREQLPALAAQGRRAIALDMRGYGASLRPADVAAYDRRTTVADMAAVLDTLGIGRAVFSGHDFGAALAWDLPLWLPDRVAGLAQLAVPRLPRSPMRPSEAFAMLAEQHFFHQHYFQTPGVAEAELDAAPADFLHRLMYALSGQGDYYACWRRPSTSDDGTVTGYIESLPEAPALPWPWLSADEFAYYVDEFTRSGFTGGLNWYRAQDSAWEQNAPFTDARVTVPTAFIAGADDPVLTMLGAKCLEKMAATVPGLVVQEILPGAGHFVQMEAAGEVNRILDGFLREHVA